jgi:FkbM family methyltransferase
MRTAPSARFLWKKFCLLAFLTRRIPRHGWQQWVHGLRERGPAYTAMELSKILPASATTIIDAGAHHGDFADALDFLYAPRNLLAVEANPALGEPLRARFTTRPHISVITAALAESKGAQTFNVYNFDAASSFYTCRTGHLNLLGFDEQHQTITVSTTTLESIFNEHGLQKVDLLKLDCQGAELAILRGAGSRLGDIQAVFTEVSFDPVYERAPLFGELHSFLREAGFILSGLSGFSGQGTSIQWADALYLNQRTLK